MWNCAEEGNKGIDDLEEGGWKKYVCVEPGSVSGFEKLSKGSTWVCRTDIDGMVRGDARKLFGFVLLCLGGSDRFQYQAL